MTALPKLKDFADPTHNPFLNDDIAFGDNEDPYPLLAQLREQHGHVAELSFREVMGMYPDPTAPADVGNFMVLTYEAAQKALQSPEIFGNGAYIPSLGVAFGKSISIMDAPEHGRYRRIFQKIFLPQYVREWGSTIVDPVVNQLMDTFRHTGKADLVKQFTLHYPFGVIYKQLELPPEEGAIFQKLAIAQTLYIADSEHSHEATRNLGEYFREMVKHARTSPGSDLVSLLVEAQVDGEYLPEDVLVSFFRQLMNAAGDTTYRGTTVLLMKLLQNPDQLDLLRADRSLLPNAIEEALRYDGPVLTQTRVARVDTEFYGHHIPKGAIVQVVAGAANRDPAVFADPDKFDITRENAKHHMSFSQGPHICVGQHLARVEMTRAMTAILDNLHNLRLDPAMPPPQLRGALLRRAEHLHVLFDPC